MDRRGQAQTGWTGLLSAEAFRLRQNGGTESPMRNVATAGVFWAAYAAVDEAGPLLRLLVLI